MTQQCWSSERSDEALWDELNPLLAVQRRVLMV